MARRAKGYSLYPDARTGNWIVRFTWQGKRHTLSTGETDARRARDVAERIYSETVSGKRQPAVCRPPEAHLPTALAKWLVAMANELPASLPTLKMYVKAHWLPFFGGDTRCPSISGSTGVSYQVTDASVGDYMRMRLGQVTASTVRKELSALRRFFAWAEEQGLMEAPKVPSLPKRATGKRVFERETVLLTPKQVEKVLAALPEWSAPQRGENRGRRFPVRAFYTVMWETGLRRGTLRQIETPKHYRPGSRELVIDDAIDKARYGRVVPLTERAERVLGGLARAQVSGKLFGGFDSRDALRRAALAANVRADLVARLSDHDFRHSRTTDLVERTGDLLGVGYLVGHTQVSTTSIYSHQRRSAADNVLRRAK